MNNELVKELASVRTWLAASDEYAIGVPSAEVSVAVIDRAIAFISSQDSVRDRALEEAALSAERYLGYRLHGSLAENLASDAAYHKTRKDIAATIRALKSAPFTRTDGTTSPEPQMYERHKGKDGACLSADTRGTVEDRRKSDKGHCRGQRRKEQIFGRRPGDRARWTGEAAPVVENNRKVIRGTVGRERDGWGDDTQETLQLLDELLNFDHEAPVTMGRFLDAMTVIQRKFDELQGATQPAQEAPPFREQDNLYEALSRVGDEIITLIARRRGDK